MNLKLYKPTTPSNRHRVTLNWTSLWKGYPFRKLVKGFSRTGGRNSRGKITSYHRGGGHKKLYRIIDYKWSLFNVTGIVKRVEYDPYRSANIALILYDNALISYILAPYGLEIGDNVKSYDKNIGLEVRIGNSMPLRFIPIGSFIHNVEISPGKGGQLARAAGSSVQLIAKNENGYAILKLSSGRLYSVSLDCMSTIGIVSNLSYKNIVGGKAGFSRWKGIRPTVRGVAMNPIDHPHGGGEGKTSGGRPSVSPWGKITKGKKTRKKKNILNKLR